MKFQVPDLEKNHLANQPLYRAFNDFLKEYFPYKVQKISLHAGFTCPNRDGKVGLGGCTYCNNQTFNPAYCQLEKTITQQLEEGIRFFGKKYPEMKYLAYFQAYTNTYGSLDLLKERYEEALAVPGVVGLVIGTRPDSMWPDLYEYLSEVHKRAFVLVEYGLESCYDNVLQLINRGHSYKDSVEAIKTTASHGIPVGVHMILGLPGRTEEEQIAQADMISELPIDTLKLHQLQLIKGTKMAQQVALNPQFIKNYQLDEYIDFVIAFLRRLRADIVVERFVSQSPDDLLVAPRWGVKNYEFVDKVKQKMRIQGVVQGDSCNYIK
ncbi:MAG: TIGR01212 family radical SAM protein [Bacteroidaceae bacterium]